MREYLFAVAKKLPNVPNRSVRVRWYLNRAKSMPSDVFVTKKTVSLPKVSRRCTIRQAPQAKPDAYRLSAIVANDDAGLESFFAAVPLRRVADDIQLPSGTHPKYDFEANLWQKGVNLT